MTGDLDPTWLVVLLAATVTVLLGVPAIDRWNDRRRNHHECTQHDDEE